MENLRKFVVLLFQVDKSRILGKIEQLKVFDDLTVNLNSLLWLFMEPGLAACAFLKV